MKRIIFGVLAVLTALSLAACAEPQPGETDTHAASTEASPAAASGTADEAGETGTEPASEAARETTAATEPETGAETEPETQDSRTAEMEERYNAAMELLNNGQYDEAEKIFGSLGQYKDSKAQLDICRNGIFEAEYQVARALYDNGQYAEALEALQRFSAYKDGSAMMESCRTHIKAGQYDAAMELYNGGRYEEAAEQFKALGSYEDSADMVEKCREAVMNALMEALRSAEVGDTFLLGSLEQDHNNNNGTEKIEWVVLAKEEGRLLAISRYVLDTTAYYNGNKDVTWETCSLRNWMNRRFLRSFDASERDLILPTQITVEGGSGANPVVVEDEVFPLSIEEVMKYLPTDEARKCTPTAYAEFMAVYTSYTEARSADVDPAKMVGKRPTCWWWLRSPGETSANAAYVTLTGSVDSVGQPVRCGDCGVRPAMWLRVE